MAPPPLTSTRKQRISSATLFHPTWIALFIIVIFVVVALIRFDSVLPSFLFAPGPESLSPPTNITPTSYHDAAPFVFDSLHGLLKQWPNSYAPNGHSIVVGTVPPHTQLFHGKHGPGLPDKLPFFAFDAEMSLGIFGATASSVIHTLAPTRPLRVIYFDGQSATLTETGTLDSQMAILGGEVPSVPVYNHIYDEDQRALDLCALVDDLGIDGVVRMNAGFEILLCNWPRSGVEHLFASNLTLPGNRERAVDKSLPNDPNRQPPLGFGNAFGEQGSFEWLRSATWHYGNYGQGGPAFGRVKPDLCTMVSFYDPELASLSSLHHGRIIGNQTFQNGWGLRRGHRLVGISSRDVKAVKSRIRENIGGSKCSGIEWAVLAESIVAQHKTRLLDIAKTISSPQPASFIVTRIHELSHAILYAYLEYPFAAIGRSAAEVEALTVSRCSSAYTSKVNPSGLSKSEMLLYHSINVVLNRLCSFEWDLLKWSEKYTTQLLGESDDIDLSRIQKEIEDKQKLMSSLLAWIGWDNWTQCEAQCSVDQLCAIPTWPVVYAPGFPQGGIYAVNNTRTSIQDLAEFWRPKCINRTDFDRGGGRGRDPDHQFPDIPSYNEV
ncbi:hypothetical protein F5B22DRAFT_612738 [Xylaria bambusicola]|uniref:uncharacterized protein n=1 Tax=Xylaria bambusicola TaxID=326684 RepID=UPI0020087BC5|nr:uncharacterized protein F5B22DRAFT_612738 [Xylaria bambusicola]KAI0513224.1 hypothetical protein F5B22DRAFT_612738 [Xylaria bambusicola]